MSTLFQNMGGQSVDWAMPPSYSPACPMTMGIRPAVCLGDVAGFRAKLGRSPIDIGTPQLRLLNCR